MQRALKALLIQGRIKAFDQNYKLTADSED